MTNDDDNECACTGCQLQVSLNGAPPVPVTDGQGTAAHTFNPIMGQGAALATMLFTFNAEPGTCDPERECQPKTPCKVKDPSLAISTGAGVVTVTVTPFSGPISPAPTVTAVPSGTSQIIPMMGVGGSGTPGDETDPYTLSLPCGGTPHSWRIRIDCFDPTLGAMNGQEVTVTVTCTSCEVA